MLGWILVCANTICLNGQINLLHNFQWITFSTQPYLALYFFCASLLYSLIIWLTVSSLSPLNLHLLIYYVLWIFFSIIIIYVYFVLDSETKKKYRQFSVSLFVDEWKSNLVTKGASSKKFGNRRCPWSNCYRRRNWTRWLEFKSWTRLIAFHIALIPLGKVWI